LRGEEEGDETKGGEKEELKRVEFEHLIKVQLRTEINAHDT
jgi:hypothetical protein